jgi:hypothetical protein
VDLELIGEVQALPAALSISEVTHKSERFAASVDVSDLENAWRGTLDW